MHYRIEEWSDRGYWFTAEDYLETQDKAANIAAMFAWIANRKMRVLEVDINNLKVEPRVTVTY